MNQKDSKLLLHVCCGPCAAIPARELMNEFEVSSYFFNPNIYPNEEKELRKINAKKVADFYDVDFIEDDEEYSFYLNEIRGKEKNEGSPDKISNETLTGKERCKACYRMRLQRTAKKAKEENIINFSTTLLISPYQDIEAIKMIGDEIAEKEGLTFIFKDFRPKFQESRVLTKEMDLYRQKYCGCSFSKNPKP